MPKKPDLIVALRKIIDHDDEEKDDADLAQHDRHAGWGRGVRDMANIARKALHED